MTHKTMTREEAIRVRELHLNGGKVPALQLQLAVHTLSRKRDKRLRLPDLPREVISRCNCTLLFNLGLACGMARSTQS